MSTQNEKLNTTTCVMHLKADLKSTCKWGYWFVDKLILTGFKIVVCCLLDWTWFGFVISCMNTLDFMFFIKNNKKIFCQ